MKKHIIIADKIAPEGIDFLRRHPGFEVEYNPGLERAELCKRIQKHHAIIVRSSTKITADVLEASSCLEVIGRAGVGVDNIDVATATERGIAVLNTPDANSTTTAELTLAHILSLSRNLPQANRSVNQGKWNRSQFMGVELANKTLGLIGYGAVGRLVAERAKGIKMNVAAYDPFVTQDIFKADNVEPLGLEELLAKSDFVSLHCPANERTWHLLDATRIASMKSGARLVNCARGGLVDETALFEGLQSGHLAGAALDVFENEPPENSPLLTLGNVVVTPHLGASTREAQVATGVEIARQVSTYLTTGESTNAINLHPVSLDKLVIMRPYLSLTRRLSRLLALMVAEPIEQLEVTLYGDACQLDVQTIAIEGLAGLLSEHMSRPINRVNASHIAQQHGIRLIESVSQESQDYHSVVGITARHGDRKSLVGGTLFGKCHPRLVRINNYEVEAVLEGHLLVTRHIDQPGVIATLSKMLADRQINISRMQLGIVPDSNQAVCVLCISKPLDQNAMAHIESTDAITQVLQISL